MKLKWIMIVSLLLFILTIAAVSAESGDNSTLAVDDNQETVSDSNDEKVTPDLSFGSYSGEHYVSDQPELWVEFKDENISGTVALRVDGVEKINRSAEANNCFYFSQYGNDLEYNTPYNISILYSGDDKYLPWSVTEVYTLNYIKFDTLTDLDVDVCQWATVSLPEDAGGDVSLYVDGKLYDTEKVSEGKAMIWLENFKYGLHTYEFRYTGDKKYPAANASGTFNVSYTLNFGINDGDTFHWGEDVVLDISTPNFYDEITLIQNGEVKKIVVEEGYDTYALKDLKYGENILIFDYEGDSKHPHRTIERTIYVVENIICPGEIRYASGDAITIRLPEDAAGSIVIYENDTQIAASDLKSGAAAIDLSFLGMGNHTIIVNYTGDDYALSNMVYDFKTIPFINYTRSIKIDEDNTMSVILPEDAEGYVTLEYCHEIVANESMVNGKVRFDLNFLRLSENQMITVTCNSTKYGIFKRDVEINVRKVSKDGKLIIEAPKTVIFDSPGYFRTYMGFGAGGNITLTIANNTVCEKVVDGEAIVLVRDLIKDLDFATYTVKAEYSGDEYYKPLTNETTVKIAYISFSVPEIVTIGNEKIIYVSLAEDATGDVNLYIDGKYVKSAYCGDWDDDSFKIIDLSDLDFGEYKNVVVKYMGNHIYKPYSEKHAFNVTYRMGIFAEQTAYGYPTEIWIECYGNINGKGILTVDGKNYTVKLEKGWGSIMIPDLAIGKYNATFLYNGDSVYPRQSVTEEFEVTGQIKCEEKYYIGNDRNISLKLPGDAAGNLMVKIYQDDWDSLPVFKKSSAFVNGIASVSLDELKLGSYLAHAYYNGTDYDVGFIENYFSITIKVNDSGFEIGRENNLLIELPSDATGQLNFTLSDGYGMETYFTKTFDVNGSISISLKGYGSEEYNGEIEYEGNYGNYSTSNYFYILKRQPTVSVSIPKEIIANDVSTLTFTLPKDATGEVWVEINDDYFYAKIKSGKASVKITPQSKGIRLINYGWEGDSKYESWSDYNFINVLKTPTIKASDLKTYYNDGSYYKVTVRDSFGKLVVGKYVTFYIAGKKVGSAKTDKKGVAKLKVTKLPGTYKITAKYRGASVTKKVTVRQVLTLKTVKVKKSAKKLVLTATLKKGKKAIKYKYVKFYFKGKFVKKVKTNKYGVAKVTVKKSALKKLKVGKKVTYKATYVKDTVKKTVKVKR